MYLEKNLQNDKKEQEHYIFFWSIKKNLTENELHEISFSTFNQIGPFIKCSLHHPLQIARFASRGLKHPIRSQDSYPMVYNIQ